MNDVNDVIMPPVISPRELYRRARAVKLTRKQWCRDAGIAESTFARWLIGRTSITFNNYANLVRILIEMEKKSCG